MELLYALVLGNSILLFSAIFSVLLITVGYNLTWIIPQSLHKHLQYIHIYYYSYYCHYLSLHKSLVIVATWWSEQLRIIYMSSPHRQLHQYTVLVSLLGFCIKNNFSSKRCSLSDIWRWSNMTWRNSAAVNGP